ncbi:MAG: hypothetical protein ACLVCH_06640 [Roseburia inulinivorans]
MKEAKGIVEMGSDFGLSEEDITARLQKKLNVSLPKSTGISLRISESRTHKDMLSAVLAYKYLCFALCFLYSK